MSDDLVGGSNIKSNSVDDVVAAKLKAKALEAEREAREGGGAGQSGGINIGGSIGSAGGSVAGRDLIGGNVTTTTSTNTGMSAADFAQAFETIYAKITEKPAQEQPIIRMAVDAIKTETEKEAVKGQKADENAVTVFANSLLNMAPDILEVIATTFANPAAGVATVIRKILAKAKGQTAG
jgi:hypothetical protein